MVAGVSSSRVPQHNAKPKAKPKAKSNAKPKAPPKAEVKDQQTPKTQEVGVGSGSAKPISRVHFDKGASSKHRQMNTGKAQTNTGTDYRYANKKEGVTAVKKGVGNVAKYVAAGYAAKEAGYQVGKHVFKQSEEKAKQTGRRAKAVTNATMAGGSLIKGLKNLSTMGKVAKASVGIGAATLVADAATAVAVDRKWISKDTAKACYTASNVVGYAATGAAIGSCFGPGPGTLIGGLVGAGVGALISAPMFFSA